MTQIFNREMTPEEISEREEFALIAKQQEEALQTAREEAVKKIESLGLTVEEIKAALGLETESNV